MIQTGAIVGKFLRHSDRFLFGSIEHAKNIKVTHSLTLEGERFTVTVIILIIIKQYWHTFNYFLISIKKKSEK